MASSSMSKNWCFTVNNYTELDEVFFKEFKCRYMVYGREVGDNLTPHLQGYIALDSNSRLSGVKKLHARAHWEMAKGTAEQNRVYCTKQGQYVETGIMPISKALQGDNEKARWELARQCAQTGEFDKIDADIYMRCYSTVKRIYSESQHVPPALDGALQNEWIYGPAGTGKSTKAHTENPGAYLKGLNKWWDGYQSQSSVIVDDMDPYHKSLAQDFKQWAHHLPFPAESKGAAMTIRPKKIIVTSNYSIDQIWEDQTTREAIKRRFKQIHIEAPMWNIPVTSTTNVTQIA